jgi:hypothetical protein
MHDHESYANALVTFRDLCDDVPLDFSSEYVRGGVNLMADLFGVVGRDTGDRMEDILQDLQRIPMFADRTNLGQYGIKPYVHNPDALRTYEVEATLSIQADTPEHAVAIADGDFRDPARQGLFMRVTGPGLPSEGVLLDADDWEYPED